MPWKARPQFVTQNKQQASYAARHGIPNPVPDLPFGEHAEDFFLYMGRVIEAKGVDTAIQVAKEADTRLVIAGAPDPGFVERTVRPRLSSKIEFLGEVDEATRDRLLRTAKAFLFPTRYPEGMPLSVLEASVCGTPVISSDAYGAAKDLIEDGVNGFVCGSVQEMVAATSRIESLDRWRCRRSVQERFSLASTTRQLSSYTGACSTLASPM